MKSLLALMKNQNMFMLKDNSILIYYGPHPCQQCDVDGSKGTLIVRAGNGAPRNLIFDYPQIIYPNTKWKKHKCKFVNIERNNKINEILK